MTADRRDLNVLLHQAAALWKQRQHAVLKVADELEREVGPHLAAAERAHLIMLRNYFGDAVQELVRQTSSPELVLATTGTTSSGKSTLANFLIGEEILPSAVQEMSAGLVVVRHHDSRRTLTIASTRGATWEVGTWDNLDAAAVRHRLAATMETSRAAATADSNVAPAHFEIDWPIRLASRTARLGLPAGTRVTLLDLPGLRSVNDGRNGPLIRKHIKQALCLVAYNAEETDESKQKELLHQVIEQVLALRSSAHSLGRMLFLLNRVDAFQRNEDAEASLDRFRHHVAMQLRAGLLARLPEERAVLDLIEPAVISSLPALWATEAQLDPTDLDRQVHLLDLVEQQFASIFPKAYWKKLPRDLGELTHDERRHLIADTIRYSHAERFEERLADHIATHLPEIVLNGPVEAAYRTAGALLFELDRVANANLRRSAEQAEAARARLERAFAFLQNAVGEAAGSLEALAPAQDQQLQDIGVALQSLEGRYGLAPDTLAPFRDLSHDLITTPVRALEDFCERVLGSADPTAGRVAAVSNYQALKAALTAVQASPYGQVWEHGGSFPEGPAAEAVRTALTVLVDQFSIAVRDLIRTSADDTCRRAAVSLEQLGSRVLARLEQVGNEHLNEELTAFPGLRTAFQLDAKFPPFASMDLKFDPAMSNRTHVEQRDESSFLRRFFAGIGVVQRHLVTYEVNSLEVPGFGDLIARFFKGGESGVPVQSQLVETRLKAYVLDAVTAFGARLKARITEQHGGYQRAIDHSHHEIGCHEQAEQQAIARHQTAVGALLREQGEWMYWEPAAAAVEARAA